MHLRLFHGRHTPDEQLSDWGFDGPTLGPLRYVHTTYAAVMHVGFVSKAAAAACGITVDEEDPTLDLYIVDDLLVHDGKYYGDWSVYVED